jgi:hypothetical protein
MIDSESQFALLAAAGVGQWEGEGRRVVAIRLTSPHYLLLK